MKEPRPAHEQGAGGRLASGYDGGALVYDAVGEVWLPPETIELTDATG
ncbi:hypothetical protein LK459_19995 [Gordonia otitidis]|nr:hypothetical protein [Gordonia otitidis]UEA58793.1 hypothetical protein LK459_19995 [Gordonia otitidis]